MRPNAGGEPATTRSRKGSLIADNGGTGGPTSFFMMREGDVMGSTAGACTGAEMRGSSGEGKNTAVGGERTGSNTGSSTEASGTLDSVYGVQSLEEALGDAFPSDKSEEGESKIEYIMKKKNKRGLHQAPKTAADKNTAQSSPANLPQPSPNTTSGASISAPLTPLQLESPFPHSAIPSTPKSGSFRSLRLSDEEESVADTCSQAIISDDEESVHVDESRSGVAPELVMPSLSMPSRRPFTARGRAMGRLKVCVAGSAGIGKTSLINAIVQQCTDIVHMDPLIATPPTFQTPTPNRPKSRGKKPVSQTSTSHITEIYASTRAYPAWWSEMEESKILRRRKSMGDTVLERNICFVDTPGLVKGGDVVVRYLEGLLHRNASVTAMNDSDLLNCLSGGGGVQVDVVLYVFSSDWTIQDIEYCKRISKLTNIVPIIGRADTLLPETYHSRKKDLLRELEGCDIQPFLFGKSVAELFNSSPDITNAISDSFITASQTNTLLSNVSIPVKPLTSSPPFAISSLPGSDFSEMDASLLMSPSYSPPLLPSDLADLVTCLFDPENIAWLRHNAVRKFLQWRDRRTNEAIAASGAAAGAQSALGLGIRDHVARARAGHNHQHRQLISQPTNLLLSSSSSSTITSPFNLSSSALGAGLSDYTRARLRDHVASEERLAQVHLAKWASDLQRCLRREREAFETLRDRERASWLLERIGEEVRDGKIGLVDRSSNPPLPSWALAPHPSSHPSFSSKRNRGRDMELPTWARAHRSERDPLLTGLSSWRDPLGLCGMSDLAGRGLGVVVKVLGWGVLGGAVWVAVARAWGGFGGEERGSFGWTWVSGGSSS